MLLLARHLVRRIVEEPLAQVVDGVEKVAAGGLEVHVPDQRRDELGRLAKSFNAMTESLRAARAAAQDESATRAALEARVRHVQTLAAAGEVAASLAHEIGSPLNVILGRARMMAARADTSAATKRDLEIVAEQTERITRVVRKLLEISRPSRGRVEEVDLQSVVDETLAFVAPECKKRGIVTSSRASGGPQRVLADRDQLVQIVFNLCHNAIQAQPGGGRIDVTLERVAEGLGGAPNVVLTVTDAGPGVAPEVRGRVFDPFVTTKEGGTGLGLAIVDGAVRELGGRVEVDDAPGGGACFRVTLPAAARRSTPGFAGGTEAVATRPTERTAGEDPT
jgi:signal transduction histidine kinase